MVSPWWLQAQSQPLQLAPFEEPRVARAPQKSPSNRDLAKSDSAHLSAFTEVERRARSDAARLHVKLLTSEEQRHQATRADNHSRQLLRRQREELGLEVAHSEDLRVANRWCENRLELLESRAKQYTDVDSDNARLAQECQIAEACAAKTHRIERVAEEREAEVFALAATNSEISEQLAASEAQVARLLQMEVANRSLQERVQKLQSQRDRQEYLEKSNAKLRQELSLSKHKAAASPSSPSGARPTSPSAARRSSAAGALPRSAGVSTVTPSSSASGNAELAARAAALEAENTELRAELESVALTLERWAHTGDSDIQAALARRLTVY